MIRRRRASRLKISWSPSASRPVPRELGLERDAELAHDVEPGLQARPVRLEERRRVRLALESSPSPPSTRSAADSGWSGASRPASTRCQRSERVGDRPADARGGVALVGDRVPGAAQVDARPAAARRRGGPRRRRSRSPVSRERRASGIAVSSPAIRRRRRGGRARSSASGSAACCRAAARARARSWRPPPPVRRRSPGRSGPWPAGTSWRAARRASSSSRSAYPGQGSRGLMSLIGSRLYDGRLALVRSRSVE